MSCESSSQTRDRPPKFWCHQKFDVTKILVTSNFWWHQNFGDIEILMSPKFRCHQNFDVTKILMSPKFRCHQNFDVTKISSSPPSPTYCVCCKFGCFCYVLNGFLVIILLQKTTHNCTLGGAAKPRRLIGGANSRGEVFSKSKSPKSKSPDPDPDPDPESKSPDPDPDPSPTTTRSPPPNPEIGHVRLLSTV